ncbi:unnamed protein product [Cylicocyclus nassatus]|uniref:Decapping nuclease n=1 Tax=Cylicocyclus nassatus TaxID=53992 RepID=A0AA36GN90_CYLNA|nr:unnamed protein product [Cylicocyclus nassatus]
MVELKTRHYAQKHDFDKDFSCYLQSFLVGIVDNYVGYHNGRGIVTRVTCDRDLVPARAKYLYNEEALVHGLDNVSYDLNQGFEAYMEMEKDKYERKQLEENSADERLDNFWKWIIMEAPKGSSVKEVLHDADIVCCRGLLKRIASTVYVWSSAWEFSAVRFNDVVFLCEQERYTSWHNESRGRLVPLWYRGLKFEQYMTVNGLNEEPRTDEPVTCEEQVVVFLATLGPENGNPLKLVFNGSIDAIKAG